MINFYLITLFPEYFLGPLSCSIVKRAHNSRLIQTQLINLRDYASDVRRTTDDRPYGGGAGMVMMVEPIDKALQQVRSMLPPSDQLFTVLTSASGIHYTQQQAVAWSHHHHIAIICGHYEGVDQRVVDHLIDAQVSIGEYVLTGGEPAAAVILDSMTRLVPGAVGNEVSTVDESHQIAGRLEYPHYTRPSVYKGWQVPPVLLEGNHAAIAQWREHARPSSQSGLAPGEQSAG